MIPVYFRFIIASITFLVSTKNGWDSQILSMKKFHECKFSGGIMTNPNQQIIKDAWARLWNKTKYPNYYLPTAILNGIKANGVVVSPLGDLEFAELGPFALFKKPVVGSISLDFTNNVINGLQTMSDQGIEVAKNGLSFTATVGVQSLNSTGDFRVDATGLSVCAVDSVWALGQVFHPEIEAVTDPNNDPGIQQAKSYRSQLLAQGPHGQALVGTYYDNNDVYNDIANDPRTTFNYNWPSMQTTGLDPSGNKVSVNSKILSQQTTSAAQNPSSSTDVVGYDAFNLHSYISQGLMIKSIDDKIDKLTNPYGKGPYPPAVQAQLDKLHKALDATFIFGENTKPVTGDKAEGNGMSVDAVMLNVKNNTPITSSPLSSTYMPGMSLTELVKDDEDEKYREAMSRAEELTLEFYEKRETDPEFRAETTTPVHGAYSLVIPVPTMSISGVISISGGKLNVTITNVSASSPSLTYNLKAADGGSGLFTEVVSHYAKASYIHKLAQQKANSTLNSAKLKSYMTDRINQSINKIFG